MYLSKTECIFLVIFLISYIFPNIFLLFRLRSRVASGQTGQPPASDMMELAWDPELATIAQAHADQCKFRSDSSNHVNRQRKN